MRKNLQRFAGDKRGIGGKHGLLRGVQDQPDGDSSHSLVIYSRADLGTSSPWHL